MWLLFWCMIFFLLTLGIILNPVFNLKYMNLGLFQICIRYSFYLSPFKKNICLGLIPFLKTSFSKNWYIAIKRVFCDWMSLLSFKNILLYWPFFFEAFKLMCVLLIYTAQKLALVGTSLVPGSDTVDLPVWSLHVFSVQGGGFSGTPASSHSPKPCSLS